MAVVIETTLGDFTVDLFIEDRPHTCKNFLKLCKMKYYNFCLFHSVQHNFIAQTGDPSGTGKNGESVFGKIYGEEKKFFEAEMMPKIKHTRSGLLSMVNCGDNMLGSQFFLTLGNELQSLDNEHCIFGEVSEGHEILLKLNDVICDTEHRPYQDIRITHTVILEDPFDDPPGLLVPDSSPEPSNETLLNARIAPDEELDETKGRSAAELEEMAREREAKAQATILEIVGDLPDAEIAPPENVLFVCKLNPVTTDDDLEIIFSRFGKVKGCEVIRDKVTGDSLQYAFVEFEEQKACEDAFFKMDNVLIDDRRIHVDFSQSVSKLRWKGKGRGVEHFDGQVNTSISSKRNSNKLQDKQSKGDHSKKEGLQEVSNYQDSSRSGKATEGSPRKTFKQDDKHSNDRKDYVLKSDDFRRGNEAMNDRHKAKNKRDPSEERAGDCYENKHGRPNDGSHTNKNARDGSYKDHPSSDRRCRDENKTGSKSGNERDGCYQEEHSLGNQHMDKKTRGSHSRNERDGKYQEELSSGNQHRDENKRGSKSRNERECSYQEDLSSGNRHRDENKLGSKSRNDRECSYQEELSSGNQHRDEKKQGSKSRNEKDRSYQEELSSSNWHRDENKQGSKGRNERDGSYQEELSSGNHHQDEKKQGSKSRNERDRSYQKELSSGNLHKDENKQSSKSRNERDGTYQKELSSGNRHRDENKLGSKSKNERDRSYQEELSSGNRYGDENRRGNKSGNEQNPRYQEESGSQNIYKDENKRGSENKNERDGSYQEVPATSNKYIKDIQSTRDKSTSHNREHAGDGINIGEDREPDKRTSRNERDKRGDRYREYSGSVDPFRDEERRGIYTSRDKRDIRYQKGPSLVDAHRCDKIRDRSYTYEGKNASERENTSSISKRQESHEYGRTSSENRSESSNNLKRVRCEAGNDSRKESLLESEKYVDQADSRSEKKLQKHVLVQSIRQKSDLLDRGHSTSKKNAEGRSENSTKTKKRRSPSSSSSSSDSDSSSSSSSSSSDSSSSSSSDSSDKASRSKRKKLSKKSISKKQIVKSKKNNEGTKIKQAEKKSKRKESSSEEADSDSSTSSSSSSDNERKYVKSSKKVR